MSADTPASAASSSLEESAGWRERGRGFARAWLKPLLLAFLIVAPFRSAVADWHDVPTGSMKPTVVEGDRVFVSKLAYDLRVPLLGFRIARLGEPSAGDVVTLSSPKDGMRLLKRVIAVGGDNVELIDNQLVINGNPLSYDPFPGATHTGLPERSGLPQVQAWEDLEGVRHRILLTPRRRSQRDFGPIQVPEDHLLLMGDNRDDSADSRVFGFAHRDLLQGRVIGVMFSFDPRRFLPRWERTCIPLE
jgi:signal peptidase I